LVGAPLLRFVLYKMLNYRRETGGPLCRMRYSFGKRGRLELGDNILQRSVFNHCDIIVLKICRIRWEKTQNKGYYAV